jgi:TRAP-type C4-dicarboxylate transport system substrate-binding protein
MQSKVLDAANTSSSSFVSYRIYEQVSCYTPAGDNALWFMYQPLLINKTTFEDLTVAQQEALRAAAKKAQAYYLEEAKKQDAESARVFRRGRVSKIAEMSDRTSPPGARWRRNLLCGVQWRLDAGRPEAARHGARGRVIAA